VAIFKNFKKFRQAHSILFKSQERFEEIRINQGVILANLNANKTSTNLFDHEFKVFSQWGEDGIIQRLVQSTVIKNQTFIEFGIEDFTESNLRFLMMKDNWRGFVIDGSAKNISKLKNSYYFWKHELAAEQAFITRENINALLAKSGFDGDVGILSVDLDGMDYFILEAITAFKPRILICEYNAVFGQTRKISVPYQPNFMRTQAHYSNLYWGASLAAMTHLANKKGYALVGTNSVNSNAFYVRKDLVNKKHKVLSASQAFAPSYFRESRDQTGKLTYISGDDRLSLIKGLPVMNVETLALEKL
jgi:hypothetical protein